jgi:hypothetical protein
MGFYHVFLSFLKLANPDKYRLSGEMMFSHFFQKMPILAPLGYKAGYKNP